jgi:hypothetical protein
VRRAPLANPVSLPTGNLDENTRDEIIAPVPGLTPADEDDDPEHADTITFAGNPGHPHVP